MMVLLKCLCILSVIATTYEQLFEPGAACPNDTKCTYEEECPASSRHGPCGADKNYKSLVCCTSSGTIKVLNYYSARQFPDRTQCGRSGVLNQIYNGDRTEIGEYPWVAALLYVATKDTTYDGVKCGGTLITEKFFLTASHCVIDQTAESIRVLLGDWNITSDPDPYPAGQCKNSNCTTKLEYADKVINATIDKIILHYRNDIALLRLKAPVHFTDYVRPICLPYRDFPALTSDDEVFVAGWGITETGSQSDILLKETLHVLTNNECLEKIKEAGEMYGTAFCAANGDNDTCRGHSGGPLMKSYKDYSFNWFQLGIVGYGPECSSFGARTPIYTRVSSFIDWIIDRITPQSARNYPCITPDNRNGSCVLMGQCPVLEQQFVQAESSSEVEFIRRSLCGYHRETSTDMVCCRLSQIKRDNAMEGSSCETPKPESKDGKCVLITNCPALKSDSKAAREHIQKYQCGFDNELLVCCKTQDIVVASEPKYLEEFSSANIPNRTICGRISNNTRSEYPWLAALMYLTNPSGAYRLVCGGSLINKRFVLTAASCFDREPILNHRILLGIGSVECEKTSNCTQNLTVEQAILHPFYHSFLDINDIALVRLGSDVVFNDYVSPICLPPANLQPLRRGSEVTVARWVGRVIGNGRSSTAYLLDRPTCSSEPDFKTIHDKQQLCIHVNETTMPQDATMDLCSYTRGGSIVRSYRDQFGQNVFLEGFTMGFMGCDRTEGSVNFRISAYTSWILRTITETT